MDGILCLDKPENMTSFACCAVLRRFMQEKKAGHTGTLDPMATGVLPVLFGRATRAIPLLPVQDKRYTATLTFGYTSDTLDVWGTVTSTGKPAPSRDEVDAVLPVFRGDIRQVPPMMSALKRDGVRLYDLARRGIEVEREARPVTVHRLDLLDYRPDKGTLTLDCACSKGTYIRVICDDLGRLLGCGAVMSALRRTEAAGFSLAQCLTLEEARQLAEEGRLSDRVLPVETAFSGHPIVRVTAGQAARFLNGGALALDRLPTVPSGIVRVQNPEGDFLGLGEPRGEELAVLRLFGGPGKDG